MPVPLRWTIKAGNGCAIVRVWGALDVAAAARLRTSILKYLCEDPAALLFDLSAMTVRDQLSLNVFPALISQANRWPSIPLLLCKPQPSVARALKSGRYGRVPVYPSIVAGQAVARLGAEASPTLTELLLPIDGAARHARSLAIEACLRWGVLHLAIPACLVTDELVNGAVDNAGTIMTLRITRRPQFLLVAVLHGSPVRPVLPRFPLSDTEDHKRSLVEKFATHWGSLPSRDGRAVWATLKIARL
ncbi:STAS domain-containing protein [Actinoplanes sp. Pm04-4]|uniref:STAS domain-containing protein n=1 Tax=Paractinoplanes pyxinae TaxID=2997416 RepID=A0ABT4BCB9_9ACTN|nr:STAS domain-containing protein [Actinoplanes pyxinae]MCY1144161.1 STAS domain-containing protein [Actinoplanes pyxinae]